MHATALLRALDSLGLPNVVPRSFAAAKATFVRWLIMARSLSSGAANRCKMQGVNVRAKLSDEHAVSH
jgi:hypothetical protein